MSISRDWMGIILICFTLAIATACIPNKQMTVGSTATLLEDVAVSANKQSDLRVVREGMPAYLMLIDGMVEAVPNNARLLITAAQAYASFASAFIEEGDAEYARALYVKAKTYALRALALRGLKNPVSKPFEVFEEALNRLDEDDVGHRHEGDGAAPHLRRHRGAPFLKAKEAPQGSHDGNSLPLRLGSLSVRVPSFTVVARRGVPSA